MPVQLQGNAGSFAARVTPSDAKLATLGGTSSVVCSRSLSRPRCAAWEARPRAEPGVDRQVHPTLGDKVPGAL